MRINSTGEYLAGILVGIGIGLLFLALAVRSDWLGIDTLKDVGFWAPGIALAVSGGAWKMRLQQRERK